MLSNIYEKAVFSQSEVLLSLINSCISFNERRFLCEQASAFVRRVLIGYRRLITAILHLFQIEITVDNVTPLLSYFLKLGLNFFYVAYLYKWFLPNVRQQTLMFLGQINKLI